MRIGVVGAGHAGVEAAWQASRRGAAVVLFSGESVLPYFRPRVVALAFGQVELDSIYLRPKGWYPEHGIDLRLNAPAIHIDVRAKTVTAGRCEELFDALILATGAAPALLPLVHNWPNDVIPLWGVSESLAIQDRLRSTRRLIILGGGISGVESAVYAREAGLDVTIVEKLDRLMALQLGPNAATILTRRLRKAAINVMTGRYAETVSKEDGRLHVTLDDSRRLIGDLILTTVGAVKPLKLFVQAGLKTDRGIVVDEYQRTSVPGVFACGDIAQRDHARTSTVISATELGRGAAVNAVAFAQGHPLAYIPAPVSPLFFKHRDTEIHAVGPAASNDLEERILTNDSESVYRSVLLDHGDLSASPGGTLVGVQMVGSREDFRQLVDALGRPWEELAPQYPSLADKECRI